MSSFSVRTNLEGDLQHCFFDDTALHLGDHIGEALNDVFNTDAHTDVRVFLELVREKGIPDHLTLDAAQEINQCYLLSGIRHKDALLITGITYPQRHSPALLELLKQLNVQQLEVVRYFGMMQQTLSDDALDVATTQEQRYIEQRKADQIRQELNRHLKDMSMLNRLNSAMQMCNSPEELFQVIGVFTEKVFNSDSGCLLIFVPSLNHFEIQARWGEPEDPAASGASEEQFLRMLNQQTSQQKITGFLLDNTTDDRLLLRIPGDTNLIGVLQVHLREKASASDPVFAQFQQLFLRLVGLAIINMRYRQWVTQDAMVDKLTNLYNQRFMKLQMDREINRALRQGTFLSLVMIELDKLEDISAGLGPILANQYLIEYGHVLIRCVRKEDYACRYSESEFALILVDATQEDAIMILDRVKAECKAVLVAGRTMKIPFSSGVATFPTDGRNAADILHKAEEILYLMKRRKGSGTLRPIS